MDFNDTPPTGKENTIILYCAKCEYEQEPRPDRQSASVSYCPDCHHERGRYSPLFFVRYQDGTEDDAARKVIDLNRAYA